MAYSHCPGMGPDLYEEQMESIVDLSCINAHTDLGQRPGPIDYTIRLNCIGNDCDSRGWLKC